MDIVILLEIKARYHLLKAIFFCNNQAEGRDEIGQDTFRKLLCAALACRGRRVPVEQVEQHLSADSTPICLYISTALDTQLNQLDKAPQQLFICLLGDKLLWIFLNSGALEKSISGEIAGC